MIFLVRTLDSTQDSCQVPAGVFHEPGQESLSTKCVLAPSQQGPCYAQCKTWNRALGSKCLCWPSGVRVLADKSSATVSKCITMQMDFVLRSIIRARMYTAFPWSLIWDLGRIRQIKMQSLVGFCNGNIQPIPAVVLVELSTVGL